MLLDVPTYVAILSASLLMRHVLNVRAADVHQSQYQIVTKPLVHVVDAWHDVDQMLEGFVVVLVQKVTLNLNWYVEALQYHSNEINLLNNVRLMLIDVHERIVMRY